MKPSFGMIARAGVLKTTDSLDTVGFVAAHAESLRVLLDHKRVKGPDYPFVYNHVDKLGSHPKLGKRTWRVGYMKTHTWAKVEPYARKAIEELAIRINSEEGFEVDEIAWPANLKDSHNIHSIIYNKSLAYYFQNEKKLDSQITPIMRQMIEAGEIIKPEEFKRELIIQASYCEQMDKLSSSYDFIFSLGTSSSAPLRGVEELPDPSLIWTLGHLPVIAAPVFRCPKGLPFGIQLVSRRWNDYLLIEGVDELVKRNILDPGNMAIN